MKSHPSRHAARGQATIEFIAMGAVLLPLLLLVPLIAKYQDISHAALLASRYVALEATVRNDETTGFASEQSLAQDIRRRYFSTSDSAIKSNDAAGDFDSFRNHFWQDPQQKQLLASFNDVSLWFGLGRGSTHAEAFSAASDGKPFSLVPLAKSDDIGVKARGIYTSGVTVKLANLASGVTSYEPFDQLNLRISRHTSIAIDPWAARSPQEVEQRIVGLAPVNKVLGSGIDSILDVVVPLTEIGEVKAPKFGRLEQWRDIVPADRLKAEQQ